MREAEASLSLTQLDLAQLALFVGQGVNEQVLATLRAEGFVGLRNAHGYVVQHVITKERSITELAQRMAVTQQAASKVVRELVELGYLELVQAHDARKRLVRLSARGQQAVKASRRIRAALEKRLLQGQTKGAVLQARALLTAALERLGGAEAVRARRVPEPR